MSPAISSQRSSKEPDELDCVNPIAAQLVRQLSSIPVHVRSAINDVNARSSVANWSRKKQFKKLILGPLREIDDDSNTPMTIVVVIDALDGCNQIDNIKDILHVLPKVKKKLRSIKVKFLVLSRPEDYIRDVMKESHFTHHWKGDHITDDML